MTQQRDTVNEPLTPRWAEETIPVFARGFGSWRVSVRRLAFSSPELTRRYDRAAPAWDRTLDRLGVPDAYEAVLRRALSEEALDVVGVRPHVLDCGVGTGALSSALARVFPTPFTLEAFDISPRMLERARRRLHETDLEVTLRQGDVRELPYRDGVFDLAMTAHVLEHFVDPKCRAQRDGARPEARRAPHRVPHEPFGLRDDRSSQVANPSRDTHPGRTLAARLWPGPRPLPVARWP